MINENSIEYQFCNTLGTLLYFLTPQIKYEKFSNNKKSTTKITKNRKPNILCATSRLAPELWHMTNTSKMNYTL